MPALTTPNVLIASLLLGVPLASIGSADPSMTTDALVSNVTTTAPTAALDAYTDAATKARTERLEGLLVFTKWAHKAKAYQLRDTAYEAVIVLDPENKDARKALKYSFQRKTNTWTRKRAYKAPRPGRPEVVAEGSAKLEALDDAFVGTMMALIEEHEERLGPAKKATELRAIMAAAPNSPEIREALGYVAVEKNGKTSWATEVALATAEAREEIAKALAKARDETPDLETGELKEFEKGIPVKWAAPLLTERVRVIHNVEKEESETVARIGHFMWSFLPTALGAKTQARKGYTIFLVNGEKDRATTIKTHPLLKDEKEGTFDRIGAYWHSGGPTGFNWSDQSITRIDSSCKQITSNYIRRTYRVEGKQGWIIEGVGQYINEMVLGTRLTFSITKTEYEDKVKPRTDENVRAEGADWIAIAGEILSEAKPTRLANTLGRNTNELNSEDLVLSYSLVAYLREGHGISVFEDVLRRIGAGEGSSVVVLENVLEAPLPVIQGMLLEWINDVGGHDYDR